MNTTSTNVTLDTVEVIFNRDVTIIYYSVTIAIILCACVLNAMSIYMYAVREIRRTNFNFCLFQLATGNLVQQLGFIPYLAVNDRHIESPSWYAESIQCGFVDGLSVFFMAAFVTVYIICFMSINWYRIIKRPLIRRANKRSILRYVIAVWVIGFILITPNFLTWKVDYKHGFCVRNEIFGHNFAYFYKAFLLFIGLFVPVTTMCITYMLIISLMCCRRTNKHTGFISHTKEKHRMRVIRHIGVIISVFLVTWLPFGMYWFFNLTGFYSDGIKGEYEKTRYNKWVMIPCLMASILNIVFYGANDKRFRSGSRSLFTTKRTKRDDGRKVTVSSYSSPGEAVVIGTNYAIPCKNALP